MEQNLSFEQSMKKLEDIVSALEDGKAPLEQSMALFEEGTRLSLRLAQMLDSAEQKVTLMMRGENGEAEELPFDAQETGE